MFVRGPLPRERRFREFSSVIFIYRVLAHDNYYRENLTAEHVDFLLT